MLMEFVYQIKLRHIFMILHSLTLMINVNNVLFPVVIVVVIQQVVIDVGSVILKELDLIVIAHLIITKIKQELAKFVLKESANNVMELILVLLVYFLILKDWILLVNVLIIIMTMVLMISVQVV